jgi:NitT/TauT family transport system substrate-binding protein
VVRDRPLNGAVGKRRYDATMSRTALSCAWVLSIALLPFACKPADAPSPEGGDGPRKVSIQLNWVPEPEFGGLYEAERAGFFAAEGLAVEILAGGPGVPAPQLAASGKVDFAVVSGDQLLTLGAAGGDLVAIYAIYQLDPFGVMVHASNPISSMEELWKSKSTVACEADLAWVTMLSRTYGGRDLTFIPYSGNVAQFAADPTLAQQCFITAEPVTLELQGTPVKVFPTRDSGFNPYNGVLAARRSFLDKEAETVARLVRAMQKGWEGYLADPGPANEIMAKLNPAMSREAMDLGAKRQEPIIRTDETSRLGLGAMTAERWKETADQLVELGKIKVAPVPEGLFRWTPPVAE